MPVASTTSAPGRPRAKRSYQATTSSVTKPSPVARQGTIAGTQVRRASRRRPASSGANQRARAAASAVGQPGSGSGCRILSGGFHIAGAQPRSRRSSRAITRCWTSEVPS